MQSQPTWILRHHSPDSIHSLRAIETQDEGAFVLAGDASGRVSLTSVEDYRPRCFWSPHTKSILGIDVVQGQQGKSACVLSQGRDNKLLASLLPSPSLAPSGAAVLPSRIQSDLPVPTLLDSLDINALNFCPFACVAARDGRSGGYLVAVPHTVDSAFVDLYSLPSKQRVVRALGKADIESERSALGHRKGIVMSMYLHRTKDKLRLLAGYEDGYVKSWSIDEKAEEKEWSWDLLWSERKHIESVLALAVSADHTFAVSVGADDRLVHYELVDGRSTVIKSKSSGHASVAVRRDGRLVAVGGWDGRIRLYDAALELKDTLRYHKDTVQALAFLEARKDLRIFHRGQQDDSDDDEDQESSHRYDAGLLVSGGKDGRVCLWKTL